MISTGEMIAIYDHEFENIYSELSIEEFNSLGFEYGDSVDVYINGEKVISDIPYYSGYYSGIEELMLCGYQGDRGVKIARNCGDPTWYEFGIKEDTKIEIVLNEKAKYIDIQELYEHIYSDNRDDYQSDEEFANFRSLKGGDIKENYFFRSTSPCDNKHYRAACTDNLLKENNIQCVLNLSNSETIYESFVSKEDFNSPYYDSLYRNNNVLLLLLNVNYRSKDFHKKLANGLREMLKRKGPVLIHCAEGKDRTGFICALILCLANATYQDIIDDYMLTYKNYYNITKENNPKKYDAIMGNVLDFLYCIGNVKTKEELLTVNLKDSAIDYLRSCDLNENEIKEIIDFIIS